MTLTLTEADLVELQKLIEDMRHKEAVTIIGFFHAKQKREQQAAAAPAPEAMPQKPVPLANGHADQPQSSAPTG